MLIHLFYSQLLIYNFFVIISQNLLYVRGVVSESSKSLPQSKQNTANTSPNLVENHHSLSEKVIYRKYIVQYFMENLNQCTDIAFTFTMSKQISQYKLSAIESRFLVHPFIFSLFPINHLAVAVFVCLTILVLPENSAGWFIY